MASHGHGALGAKLYELELQLAAYKLMRAARGEDEKEGGARCARDWAPEGTRRGRQYDAYMRRRDARRMLVGVVETEEKGLQPTWPRGIRSAAVGRPSALTLNCTAARDTREATQAKRTPALPIPTTPRKENTRLRRAKTVNTGVAGPARSSHQRRSSLGVAADFSSDSVVTPRPFLRRGSGTGGAAVARQRVHDLPLSDASSSSPMRSPRGHAAARRHSRSVSEVPLHLHLHHAMALESPRSSPSPQARPRKRWGSPETPPALLSAAAGADSGHSDFTKGIKKLLSFVRKSKSGEQHHAARSGGKPVSKTGRSSAVDACSLLDGAFDRGSLDGRQFPMTRTVGISG